MVLEHDRDEVNEFLAWQSFEKVDGEATAMILFGNNNDKLDTNGLQSLL